MTDREILKPIVLLALLAAASDDGEKTNGLFSRAASRATGAVLDVVDPDLIIERVDVNAIIERVDINAVLARVDVDLLMDRIDVERLLDRVDLDSLMEKIDVDAILARVDVQDLAVRAGIPEIVKESTGELAFSAMDIFRRQLVALDEIFGRLLYRLIRRDPDARPISPAGLETGDGIGRRGRAVVTGHYAGAISRGTSFLIDALAVWASFVLMAAGIIFLIEFFSQADIERTLALGFWGAAILLAWWFIYVWFGLALAGRTMGMGLVGLRLVSRDGEPVGGRKAILRTLVFPVSVAIVGLGFLGIIVSPERRTLHDAAARTVVVYDWGDRPAEMPAPLTHWVESREPEADEAE